ncbi:hypothetical protein [Bermanella sp. R86510]|uniref:hypothetical protein n=1 Tax=unclassified Bermanella TaxID=2627862 RepID=UPI0037CAA8A4
MFDEKLKAVYPLLAAPAPDGWVKLKVLFQHEDGMDQLNTYYKVESSNDWIEKAYGGFDLLDFYDSIKGDIDIKKYPQIEIVFDKEKNMEYRFIEDYPDLFDGN